ncbi:MAG TPA: HD domain-containing phosphohydrolase [Gemmataceae bacterium]|nr:HD domain-containing phosphohydrolase [Gemmataceae bacterium]
MAAAEASAYRIVVAEDDSSNARLFEQVLAAEGHDVRLAADGVEALALIADCKPDLILLDLDMPRLNGYEVCRRVKQDPATRLIPIVMITADHAFDSKLRAWELGADDFLEKPLHCIELVARCRSLLRVKRLIDELDTAEAVLFALARAVEAKSPYTQGHAQRVTLYALALADEAGLGSEERETLRKGALLHDIGKISTPDAILDKPGELTPAEYEVVKQHPLQGARIVEPLRSLRETVPLIRWHHERLDGRGYPDHLAGEEIPILVRLLSITDVYDSLASQRPYRDAMSPATCLDVLRKGARGGKLDARLVDLFCDLMSGERRLAREPLAASPV